MNGSIVETETGFGPVTRIKESSLLTQNIIPIKLPKRKANDEIVAIILLPVKPDLYDITTNHDKAKAQAA
jgi:hypothetical protein